MYRCVIGWLSGLGGAAAGKGARVPGPRAGARFASEGAEERHGGEDGAEDDAEVPPGPGDPVGDRVLVAAAVTAAVSLALTAALDGPLRGSSRLVVAVSGAAAVALCVERMRAMLRQECDFRVRGAELARIARGIAAPWASEPGPDDPLRAAARVLRVAEVRVDTAGGGALPAGPGRDGPGALHVVEARHAGRGYGRIVVRPAGGARLGRTERALLQVFARELGACLHLAHDAGPEQEADARSEVRRRMQRDLHDGLGPVLAAVKMQIEAARALVLTDRPAAAALLEQARADTQLAVADVRRLVRELRAPNVAALVPELREQATRFQRASNDRLRVRVVTAGTLPPIPGEAVSAAYRIATEALTNAAKHARARQCTITVTAVGGRLRLEIVDDGIGIPPHPAAGLGLVSMRERARELGGDCRVHRLTPNGTRVTVTLPLHEPVGAASA